VNPRSAEFRANADAMRTLVQDLRAKAAEVELGGGAAALTSTWCAGCDQKGCAPWCGAK
jgi:hypothetical protein